MNKQFFTILAVLFLTSCGVEFEGEVNTGTVGDIKNVAIKGYDTVAYFKESKPVKGLSEYSSKWNGATWLFSSEQNKLNFDINPKKYAPQYGGYCAFGVSVPKQKIDIDPNAWHIYKGKLYLNYTTNTQSIWLEDKLEHIKAADQNWEKIK